MPRRLVTAVQRRHADGEQNRLCHNCDHPFEARSADSFEGCPRCGCFTTCNDNISRSLAAELRLQKGLIK